MSFVFQCPFCNQKLEADEEWIGQETKCPKCAGSIKIFKPIKEKTTMNYIFQCPFCNQELEAGEELIGQEVKCPKCDGTIKIPNPKDISVQNLHAVGDASNRLNSFVHPNMYDNNSTNIKFEEKALNVSKWSKYLGILGGPILLSIEGGVLGWYFEEMDGMEKQLIQGMFNWLSIFCVLGSIISGMISLGKNSVEAQKYNLSYSKTLTFKNTRLGIICSIIAIFPLVRWFCNNVNS